jgi:hypothetical protein
VKATIMAATRTVVSMPAKRETSTSAEPTEVLPPHRPSKGLRLATAGSPSMSPAEARYLALLQEKQKAQRAKVRQMWAAHDARMRTISAKLRPESLRIANGV